MIWIVIYTIALAVLGKLFADHLPHIYQAVIHKVLEDNKALATEGLKNDSHPLVLAMMFMSVNIIFLFSNNLYLSIFVFTFALLAYTDYVLRWVPDILIYLMLWISFIGISKPLEMGLLSIALFCLPALVVFLYSYFRNRDRCIASGDWYVFPSIGLWLSPDTAASYMAVCIVLVAIASRYTRDVPLLAWLFPVFVGGQLCELYSVF